MSKRTKKSAQEPTQEPSQEATQAQEAAVMASDAGLSASIPANVEASLKREAAAAAPKPSGAPQQVVIEFQGVSQGVISQVWEQLKRGEPLEGAGYTLARSLADHPHWFGFFETIGVFEGEHVSYPGDVDPFLHVNLHLLIGLQILNDQPSQARSFYVAREAMGEAPHEIIHVMMEAFQRHLWWTAMNAGPQGQLNMSAYAETLTLLQELTREDVWARLGHAEPPALHPEASEVFG